MTSYRSVAVQKAAPLPGGRGKGSTVGGNAGNVLGWVNQTAIEQGMADLVFNNFGGQERFWFVPEGGQFGLCMGRHINSPEHYDVPAAFNTQPFAVLVHDRNSIAMRSHMKISNARGHRF